jgi:hypothetical protein
LRALVKIIHRRVEAQGTESDKSRLKQAKIQGFPERKGKGMNGKGMGNESCFEFIPLPFIPLPIAPRTVRKWNDLQNRKCRP